MHITLWILFGVLVVDAIGSYAVLRHITKKMPRIAAMNDQIDAFTKRLSVRLYRYLEARVERAYPSVQPIPKQKEKIRKSSPRAAVSTKSSCCSSSAPS